MEMLENKARQLDESEEEVQHTVGKVGAAHPFKARNLHGLHCGRVNQHGWSQFKHVSDELIRLVGAK